MKFVVEYAKSGQAGCKMTKCKEKIAKGVLRIGKVSSNPFSEGAEMTNWFHAQCCFEQMKGGRAAKIESLEDLEGFDDLKKKDQDQIQKWFAAVGK